MDRPDEPLVASSLRAGFAAWARRLGILTLAFGAVTAANLPVQGAQLLALERVAEVNRHAEDRGDRIPDEQEALQDVASLGGACLGLCGATVFGVAVLMPLVSGATVLGARAVRGNGRPADLLCGFRRYGPTLVATVVTALAGGGIAVAVATVDTLRLLGTASQAVAALFPPAVAWCLGAAIGAVTLWLCARLWFASIRVADPERPRIGGAAAVSASWHWTAGAVQWQVLVLMVAAAAITCIAMLPAYLSGLVVAEFAGAWIAVTLVLAVFGAAYEQLSARLEPIALATSADTTGGTAAGSDTTGGLDG